MALNLQHQTAAEFAERFWRRVHRAMKIGDKDTLHRLVWLVWNRIQTGDLTSDQVRLSYNAYFGKSLNTTQWNNYVTGTLVPIKDRYLAYKAQGDI